MKTYTAIIRIKTSLEELATECLALFGEGARFEFDANGTIVRQQEEMTFSLCNTPVQHGYVRVIVAEHIATALQWMQDNGIESEHGELIRVEFHGQDRYPVEQLNAETGETETVYEEHLFEIGEQILEDEEGNYLGTIPVYLGRLT